jgi:hypothetical protein
VFAVHSDGLVLNSGNDLADTEAYYARGMTALVHLGQEKRTMCEPEVQIGNSG